MLDRLRRTLGYHKVNKIWQSITGRSEADISKSAGWASVIGGTMLALYGLSRRSRSGIGYLLTGGIVAYFGLRAIRRLTNAIHKEDIKNLYIAPVDGIIALVNGTDEVRLKGEILLYGRIVRDTFIVEQLRRVALYGMLHPLPDPTKDPIGMMSLAGPIDSLTLEPGPSGSVGNVRLQLHYRALSRLESLFPSRDAVFPRVEVIATNLTWEQGAVLSEEEVELIIGMPNDETFRQELITQELGIVQSVAFEPISLSFYLAGSGLGDIISVSQHKSLEGCQPGKTPPCPPPNIPPEEETDTRLLPLKFINVTDIPINPSNPPDEQEMLEGYCNSQITQACNIWWYKAALNLIVVDSIEDAPSLKTGQTDYRHIQSAAQQQSLLTDYESSIYPTPRADAVLIFLVEQLDDADGGITRDEGQASAYCILQWDLLNSIDNLLAHEIGHALGISHPDGYPATIYYPGLGGVLSFHDGSWDSVMDDTIGTIVSRNTRHNCNIFTTWPPPGDITPVEGLIPLNAIVTTTTEPDCFRPDL